MDIALSPTAMTFWMGKKAQMDKKAEAEADAEKKMEAKRKVEAEKTVRSKKAWRGVHLATKEQLDTEMDQ